MIPPLSIQPCPAEVPHSDKRSIHTPSPSGLPFAWNLESHREWALEDNQCMYVPTLHVGEKDPFYLLKSKSSTKNLRNGH